MYDRFLNNSDYKGTITNKALSQLIRDDLAHIEEAESDAECSIVEYLSENYEIAREFERGRMIREHNRQITYPVGSHFYKDGEILQVLRTINGCKRPMSIVYWEEVYDVESVSDKEPMPYSQLKTYMSGDIVFFAEMFYMCVEPNGVDFNDIRVPGMDGWEKIDAPIWEANIEYEEWAVRRWGDRYYTLMNTDDIDLTVNPYFSDNWGLIAEYDETYNQYEFSSHEYVMFGGDVYIPTMEVNSDDIIIGHNAKKHDPRNDNVRKHMVRLAIYNLYKLISPNNISSFRITDYEESMQWLRDASKLRINPKIPRKLDEDKKPITDWQVATFQAHYDPAKNPWQI